MRHVRHAVEEHELRARDDRGRPLGQERSALRDVDVTASATYVRDEKLGGALETPD